MKRTLTAAAGLFLALALASCAAPPADAPQTLVRHAVAAPAVENSTVDEPPAAPAATLTITDARPMTMPESGVLDPPDFVSVFELHDPGAGFPADTAAGPRILLTHATSFGNPPAPGNTWLELGEADRIVALGSTWRITNRLEAPKSWLRDDPALFERTFGARPGTLVLVTCVPRWEGRATHNLIIIAEEAS